MPREQSSQPRIQKRMIVFIRKIRNKPTTARCIYTNLHHCTAATPCLGCRFSLKVSDAVIIWRSKSFTMTYKILQLKCARTTLPSPVLPSTKASCPCISIVELKCNVDIKKP
ncbi:hypothetical protein AAHE18_16G163900 [Arachis hypogaea]